MKIQKKYIVAGALAIVSIALALGYLQYKKLMNYKLGFKSVKLKTLSASKIVFDIFLNFTNKSSLKFEIIEQENKLYINDKFVSDIVSKTSNKIEPNSTSVIGVNVSFNPNDITSALGKNYAWLILNTSSIKIKIDMKMKVKLYGIKVSIPFIYEDTLKGIIDYAKTPTPQ